MGNLIQRIGLVVSYAIGMAWVEAAVVVYLRLLVNRIEPYQPDPLPFSAGLGWIEPGRELATLVMLWAVGWLAGRTWRGRAGYFLLAFGTWDAFYYLFLIPMSGWPGSLLDWDVLFLVPLPWWGPVLAPLLISLLLVLGGLLAAYAEQRGDRAWPHRLAWGLNAAGVGLALFCFMNSALQALPGGGVAVRRVLPAPFPWPLFCLALVLLAAPVADLGSQLLAARHARQGSRGLASGQIGSGGDQA